VYEIATRESKFFRVKVHFVILNDYFELSASCKKNQYIYFVQKIILVIGICIKLYVNNIEFKLIFLTPNKIIRDKSRNLTHYIKEISEIVNLKWRGINIGRGIYSSLISRYRSTNLNLNFHRKEIEKNTANSILFSKWIINLIEKNQIDRIVTFSGRFNLSIITDEVAKKNSIPLYYHEALRNNDKYYYSDKKIHSFEDQMTLMNSFWNESKYDLNYKIHAADKFYVNCRVAKVGRNGLNRSFTKDQKKNYFPKKKKNKRVVFYGNSEDEYAIFDMSKDSSFEWSSQVEAIKSLNIALKNYNDVELIIRVHPNDMETRWHKLEGDFQIIDANSKVDSYALLDSADIVVTYRTSIGIEASYWKRPSVLMANSEFSSLTKFNLVKNSYELDALINKYINGSNEKIEEIWMQAVKVGYFRQEFGYKYGDDFF
jgi:hypothetical protein